MSSPLPFAWGVKPPLQLALYLPYAWIVPICVDGALFGHIVLTRALTYASYLSSTFETKTARYRVSMFCQWPKKHDKNAEKTGGVGSKRPFTLTDFATGYFLTNCFFAAQSAWFPEEKRGGTTGSQSLEKSLD
jgi:hypothetical protein